VTSALPRPAGQVFCFACGTPIDARAEICPHCGVRQRPPPSPASLYGRSRTTAALLAIFLGGLGIHKFYLGKVGQGVLYLLFCWTLIPGLIAFFEGIWYLTMLDQDFWDRYPTREQLAAWSVGTPGYWPPMSASGTGWPPVPTKRCPTCAQVSAPDTSFCPRCGTPP